MINLGKTKEFKQKRTKTSPEKSQYTLLYRKGSAMEAGMVANFSP